MALIYMSDVDGDDRAVRSPYVLSLPLYMMEAQTMTWVQLYM